jgi:hypothetical protein
MAMCEKCKMQGYSPDAMFVEADLFIGPCCAQRDSTRVRLQAAGMPAQVHVLPAQGDSGEVAYGVEVSNRVGIHAWVNYQGLEVSFERNPAQLRTWAEKQGLMERHG